jgi:hypothetical protein
MTRVHILPTYGERKNGLIVKLRLIRGILQRQYDTGLCGDVPIVLRIV